MLDATSLSKFVAVIWTCLSMIGNAIGLNLRIVIWMYKLLARPIITYGAIVWCKKTEQEAVQQKLYKIQRLILVMSTRCMRTTPNVALEKLLDLPLLYLWIQIPEY